MGNYVFTTDVLVDAVTTDAADETSRHDIGGNLIPALVERGEAQVYDFTANEVPGVSEREHSYWRDVGTLDAYYDAHMDLISVDPVFNLYNREWPILTWPESLPPAKFVFQDEGRTGHALDSMVCAGVIVSRGDRAPLDPLARGAPALLQRGRGLDPHARGRRRPGAVVRNAIVDKNVRIAEGAQVGVDPEADRERFVVSPGGIVVIAKGETVEAYVRVALLTREYPPEVYGGAGVHVEYLARELARLEDVTVHCWGADRPGGERPAVGYRHWEALDGRRRTWRRCRRCRSTSRWPPAWRAPTSSTATPGTPTSPGTWRELLYGIPHVATVHSLEPLRPWKAEQLGGGYALSSFCERTALEAADAIIAVSEGMRRDVLACYPAIEPERVEVIYNGVDTEEYRPDERTDVLERHGIDPEQPSVVFVGRITRQKGLRTCSRPRSASTRRRSSCSAPARPTRRRSAPRSSGASSGCAPSAAT